MGQTLFLARSEVERLVGWEKSLSSIRQVFLEHGRGTVTNLTQNLSAGDGVVSIKASSLSSSHRVGLKSLGLVILCEAGRLREPLAVFEAAPITYFRTGSAGAVAAKALARAGSRRVGVFGSGKQARAQLTALARVFPLESAVVWSPNAENRELFAAEMTRELGFPVTASSSPEETAEGRDVLITATRAKVPFLKRAWVSPGTHVTAVGADMPGSQELETALLESGEIFADDVEQALWMGAINVPVSCGKLSRAGVRGTLGEVLAGRIPGRRDEKAITIFDCSGLGMLDVALASQLYEMASSSKGGGAIRIDWLA